MELWNLVRRANKKGEKHVLRSVARRRTSSPGLPQMNEVAQRASVAEELPAVLIVGVAADGDGEGPLAQEGLVSGWHGS